MAALAQNVHALLGAGVQVLVRCAVAEDRAVLRDAVASLVGSAVAPVSRPPAVAALLLKLGHELPAVLLGDDGPPPEGTVLALGGPTSAAPPGWHTVDAAAPPLDAAAQVWRSALRLAGLRPRGAPSSPTSQDGCRWPSTPSPGSSAPPRRRPPPSAAPRSWPTSAARCAPTRGTTRAELARRLPAAGGLDDLVLPATTRTALADFLAHARWSPAAYAGLGLTGTRGRAVIALFHGPSAGEVAPVRIRHLIPSMSCRLLHFGGRPGFFGVGSCGASRAHCTSVRSCRLVTATLVTRSPG